MARSDFRIFRYMHLGIQFSASVLLFVFAGVWLDKRINTLPLFTLIGLFGGFAVGVYFLWREAKELMHEDTKDEE